MVTWSEFVEASPDLAATGRHLMTQFGPGLGFMATVRADGGPRLHPICPVIAEGGLWAFIIEASPKCADLRRDGRFALHSFPPEAVDDEFVVTGRATEVQPDPVFAERLRASTSAEVGRPDEVLFSLSIESAMSAVYAARGVFPPFHSIWRPDRSGS